MEGLSRRRFILGGGAATFLASRSGELVAAGLRPTILPVNTFNRTIRRREDQLQLTFEFWNLRRSTVNGRQVLVKDKAGVPSYFVVVFQPQHVGEQSFLVEPPEPLPPTPVKAALAGRSRLVFGVAADDLPLPFTTDTLLDWPRFAQRVVPRALPRNSQLVVLSPIKRPDDTFTQIEVPWHLVLSPHGGAGWAHRRTPATHSGRTELWHTRLGVRTFDANAQRWTVDEDDDDGRTVRAIWDREITGDVLPSILPNLTNPFRMAMEPKDRHALVRLTSDFTLLERGGGLPVDVKRMMLSSLGAWLDSEGSWDLDNGVPSGTFTSGITNWRHRTTMGRDHFVRVVHKGFACPPGHSAAYIEVSDREFGRPSLPGADRGAYLRTIKKVKLLRLRKLYAGDPRMPDHQRHVPFRSMRIVTRETPPIEPRAFGSFAVDEAFVPYKDDAPFLFHLVVADWAGQEQDFLTPLVWVSDEIAYQRNRMEQLVDDYLHDSAVTGLRTRSMRGQRVAARQQVAKPGDTTVQVRQFEWGAQNSIVPGHPNQIPTPAELSAIGQPDFYPSVQTFTVDLPEVQALAGSGALQPTFAYDATYLSAGSNPTQVFLARIGTGVPLKFNTGNSGGVATPNIGPIEGLSAIHGPFSGPIAAARAGTFDPAAVFDTGAKLLGGLTLAEILGPAGSAQAFKITSKQLTNPNRVEATLDWHPTLAAGPTGLDIFEPLTGAALDVTAHIINRLDNPAKSTTSIAGQLRRFRLHLFGKDTDTTFVILTVEQVRFTAGTNQKSDVHCDGVGVEFVNGLHFVAALAELCSFTDGSGLKITVDEGGIAVGLTVNVPSINVAVFSLRNLAIGAALDLPFNGDPVLVDFTFGTPDKPFILTVYGFGGGGFVIVSIGADRMYRLEIDLQFGAFIDFDVGVASGGIELAGGFNFKVETTELNGETQQNLALTLYVRLYGEVDVLGIVSVSLELYLGLTYQTNPEMLVGEAEMTLTIEVGPFDKDVSFTCRKEFASGGSGGSGVPALRAGPLVAADAEPGSLGFGDTMNFADWAEYCSRFAPVGV